MIAKLTDYWRQRQQRQSTLLYDSVLLWLIIGLLTIGLIMVSSASIAVGQRLYSDPFFFAKRELFYLLLALGLSLLVLALPIQVWQRASAPFLLLTLLLLLVVLFVGGSINGASRWIALGPLRIQPAEIAKLALCCYIASYLVRKVDEVRSNFWGFVKPMTVMVLLALLLLAQPDLGTVVVLFITTLSLLFLAGAKLWQFLAIIGCGVFAVVSLILTEAYRLRRVVSFLDPWKDPFGSGYQLIQSLMAFGRGGLWGQGLGNSIQKLAYLPEPHTDFISAILAEELGYFGIICLLIMLFVLVLRAMKIGRIALQADQRFAGFLACGIGVWIAFQTLINIGAASGMLPTKGLTLPLISYGGSSLLVMVVAVMLLIRIDYENRCLAAQAFVRGKK